MNTPIAIDRNEVLKRYKPIDKYTHKGIQGHALLIGGSYGKIGSVCLASKAALKTGCGLVTAFVPQCGYEIVQISIPEAMVVIDADALNILSQNPSWVALVSPRTILTPHPKELERLIGKWHSDEEKIGK